MTRETKIGLLVGLAFIIIVGILLSEPLNHAGESQPAPLPYAGRNVLQSAAAPGSNNVTAPVSLQPEHPAAPSNPVMTREEAARPQGGISIQIGSGAPTRSQQISSLSNTGAVTQPQDHQAAVAQSGQQSQTESQPQKDGQATSPDHTPTVASNSRDPIFDAAEQNGEPLEQLGSNGKSQSTDARRTTVAQSGESKNYEAAAGDTLAKIAQKEYGSSSKAYRDAIVAANPSLKADPNKVFAGQSYVIPAISSASATATPAVAKEAPSKEVVVKTDSADYWYTVKAGDTLWAIARDQLGDTGAVAAIEDLNQQALKGSSNVRAGMKLRLPAKPLASAN